MLFRKTNKDAQPPSKSPTKGAEVLSVIAKDTHILGTLISDGSIDFDGTIDGNIRCHMLTVRKNGNVKGDVTVEILHVYGKIDGVVRAKTARLYKDCQVEGVLMHEGLIIEDGAFMDGKCKRMDKVSSASADAEVSGIEEDSLGIPITSSIRLIN